MNNGTLASDADVPDPAPRRYRPAVAGDPLQRGPGRTVPKPALLIETVTLGNEQLHRSDRQMMNVLLAASWCGLGAGEHGPFTIPACELRCAVGQERRTDNRRLRESLDRLCRLPIAFTRTGSDGQPLRPTAVLKLAELPTGGETVSWAWSDALMPEFIEPFPWGRIDLEASAAIGSRHALVIYEHVALRARLKTPIWRISVDDLSARLGLRAESHGWHDIRRILESACREIALHTSLRPKFDVTTNRRTRRVETVKVLIEQVPTATTKGLPDSRLDALKWS